MKNTWQLTRLGKVVFPISRPEFIDTNKEYKLLGIRLEGKGPFLREVKTGYNLSANKLFQVKRGDFIYSRLFAWRGAFGIIHNEFDGCYVSNEFPIFQVNHDELDIKFLCYWFQLPETLHQVEAHCTGSTPLTRNRFKEKFFLELEIPLPPLSEQQRIVAKIERLAVKVEEAQKLRQQNEQETDVLLRATARRIFSEIQEEINEVRDWLDPSREGIQTGPFGVQLSKSDFQDSGVPVLKIGNVQYNGLITDNLTYVSEEKAAQLQRYSIKEGDILFARMGTVGRCCVVPEKAEDWLINYHIIRLALDKSRIEPRFLHWTIQASKDIEDYLSETIRGATRAGVNSKIVGSLPCRVPPKSEQCRIVAYLDNLQAKVGNLKHFQAQTQTKLDALLPSILDKVFKGEL